MFSKDPSSVDGLHCQCKKCTNLKNKQYYNKNKDKEKIRMKSYYDKTRNTFGRKRKTRGCGNIVKRDYELTNDELKRRNNCRRLKKYKTKNENPYGILIWYSEKLNNLDYKEYKKILVNEYMRQRSCAIRGYIGRLQPSEHFLFDFDLEQMLKDRVYYKSGDKRTYITKWWKGEIRHWTVNDGIWKE